jgi:signal transduction histidine kinase
VVAAACTVSFSVLALIFAATWIGMQRPLTGLFWSRGTGRVLGVMPGTPASTAGLRRGDVILSVGGEPTRLSVRRSIAAYAAAAEGETLAVSVLRDGSTRSVDLRMIPPPLRGRLYRLEFPVIAYCFSLLGFLVWAHKPQDTTVVLFLLFTQALAALVAVGQLNAMCQPMAFLWFDLCLGLYSASIVHFHLAFPRPRAFPGRRGAILGLYLLAFLVPCLYLPGLRQDVDARWYFLALNAGRLYSALATSCAAALLLHAYRGTSSDEDRRRIRLVVFGTVLACAPALGLSLLPEILREHTLLPYEATLPFLLVIPLAYVGAIQRYNLLRVERLVHRSVVHLVLVAVLALLYLTLVAGLPRLVPAAAQPLTGGLVALLIAFMFTPLRDRLQKLADRLFYGGWYDPRTVLSEMTKALDGILTPERLAGVLARRLAQTLHLDGAGLLLRSSDGKLATVEASEWPDEGAPPSPLPYGGALATELFRAARPLSRADLAGALEGTTLAGEEKRWLSRPEVELWVPLVRRRALQGILLLGAKAGGESFDSEDRRMLSTLAWSAAVAAENVRLFTALLRRADEINRLYSQLIKSREAERKRLARELHDRVIQDLINLNYFLEADGARAAKDPGPALREGLLGVIEKLRQVCSELRPSALDDLSLGLAVQGYVEEVSVQHGIKVSLRLPPDGNDGLEALPEEARLSLFRVLQEALSNVHRHSGASRVEVELAAAPHKVTLEVRDDGRGFACPTDLGALIRDGHFGLAGAQERMSLIGGSLELRSDPAGGTRVRASVPRGAP